MDVRHRLKLAVALLVVGAAAIACATVAVASTSQASKDSTLVVNGRAIAIPTNQALHDLLPDNIKSAGVIQVATDPSSPPYEMYAADNKTIVGGDVALGQAIGKVLGVNVNFNAIAFPGIIAAVKAGRFDMAMSSMGDTPAREQEINFVVYSVEGNVIIVKQGNPKKIKTIKDLCGKKVAVLRGSVMQGLAETQNTKCKKKMQIQIYPNQNEANLAVKSGRADATLNMAGTANYYLKVAKDKSLQVIQKPMYGAGYNAMGVPKTNVALLLCLQQALQRLMDSGAYKQVLSAWGLQAGAIKTALINDGAKYAQPTG